VEQILRLRTMTDPCWRRTQFDRVAVSRAMFKK
jgi:hypothetical protein